MAKPPKPMPVFERTELDEIKAILRYLEKRERRFSGDFAANAANNFISARSDFFDRLIAPFASVAIGSGGSGVAVKLPTDVRTAWDAIGAAYRQELEARVVSQAAGSVAVRTNFPIPDDDDRNQLIEALSGEHGGTMVRADSASDVARLTTLFVAGILRAWTTATSNSNRIQLGSVPPSVWGAMTRLEAYEFALHWRKELMGEARGAEREIAHVKGKVEAAAERADGLLEAGSKAIAEIDAISGRIREVGDAVSSLEADATKRQAELVARYENWAMSTDERLTLRKAGKLWDDRANHARTSWALSFAAITALIVGIPSLAVTFRAEIVDFVRQVDPGTIVDPNAGVGQMVTSFLATASHLLLVSAPLGFLVWGIRFLIRYNMRSQLLMDDATQRRTMLETYFLLIERNVADPKVDRAVLLEAMFRPPPGHGVDAPEPLNLAEIAKLGEAKK